MRKMVEVLNIRNFKNIKEMQGYLNRKYGQVSELILRGTKAWIYLEAGF